jgi:hypothetical protein
MKATIKLAVGTTVDLEGTKEEVVEGIRAALGLSGFGQAPICIPTIWTTPGTTIPAVPPPTVGTPDPFVYPPNGVIPWPGQCPWVPGTIIYGLGPNVCASPGCQEHTGYKVVLRTEEVEGGNISNYYLEPQSTGAILDAFALPKFNTNITGPLPEGTYINNPAPPNTVTFSTNDWDKGTMTVDLASLQCGSGG